jgi:positive phototaxis protein PixI
MEPETDMQADITHTPEVAPVAVPEEQFLRIYLGDVPLLLPMTSLVEIMKLPIGQVVPMFQMPPWVIGIYNCRGDMLWVADLGHFLGQPPWYERDNLATQHSVVVVQTSLATPVMAESPAPLGLVVTAVDDMVAYPLDTLQPVDDPEAIAPALAPFIRHLCRPGPGAALPVLDAIALLAAMAHSNQ